MTTYAVQLVEGHEGTIQGIRNTKSEAAKLMSKLQTKNPDKIYRIVKF